MPRVCVFCGTPGSLTREHVIPDWISGLFSMREPGIGEIVRRDGTIVSYPLRIFQQKVSVVCRRCNNGWMSKLEAGVKPFLGPMIQRGEPTFLSSSRRLTLARWAVKTGFMLEQLHPVERVVPDGEYRRFYAAKAPPRGYVVWLAHRTAYIDHTNRVLLVGSRNQRIDHTNTARELAGEVERLFAQGHVHFRITFTIGRAVFQVYGHNFPGSFQFTLPPAVQRVTQWIWIGDGDVVWPPPASVETIGGYSVLHDAFNKPQQSQPVGVM